MLGSVSPSLDVWANGCPATKARTSLRPSCELLCGVGPWQHPALAHARDQLREAMAAGTIRGEGIPEAIAVDDIRSSPCSPATPTLRLTPSPTR